MVGGQGPERDTEFGVGSQGPGKERRIDGRERRPRRPLTSRSFRSGFFRFPWAQGFDGFQANWMNFNGEGGGEREGVICID